MEIPVVTFRVIPVALSYTLRHVSLIAIIFWTLPKMFLLLFTIKTTNIGIVKDNTSLLLIKTKKPIRKDKILEKKVLDERVRTRFWKFGRLGKWRKDPSYKKVLLWTGFGATESRLWPRVVGPIRKKNKNKSKKEVLSKSSGTKN